MYKRLLKILRLLFNHFDRQQIVKIYLDENLVHQWNLGRNSFNTVEFLLLSSIASIHVVEHLFLEWNLLKIDLSVRRSMLLQCVQRIYVKVEWILEWNIRENYSLNVRYSSLIYAEQMNCHLKPTIEQICAANKSLMIAYLLTSIAKVLTS